MARKNTNLQGANNRFVWYLPTCTTSTRPTFPTYGDEVFDTTVGKRIKWDGAAWAVLGTEQARPTFTKGRNSIASNSGGGNKTISVTHGLGATPAQVLVSISHSQTSFFLWEATVKSIGATTFTVVVRRVDVAGGSWLFSPNVEPFLEWICYP